MVIIINNIECSNNCVSCENDGITCILPCDLPCLKCDILG